MKYVFVVSPLKYLFYLYHPTKAILPILLHLSTLTTSGQLDHTPRRARAHAKTEPISSMAKASSFLSFASCTSLSFMFVTVTSGLARIS